jgi:hypothetical protein
MILFLYPPLQKETKRRRRKIRRRNPIVNIKKKVELTLTKWTQTSTPVNKKEEKNGMVQKKCASGN